MSLGGDLQDGPLDEEMQVVEKDEGGRRRGPALVLLDQVVALELPDLVRALLDLLERVAAGAGSTGYRGARATQTRLRKHPCPCPACLP